MRNRNLNIMELPMNPPRRQFLRLAAGAAALPAVSRIACAQTYPSRPVRILVGFTAGGAFDIVARLLAQWLSEQLYQPFIVENRPGGSTNIATEAAIRAPADGYTLLLGGATNAINATFYEKLNFNFIRDVAPVAGVARFPNVMEVNPSFPAKTVPEFIAYATANPGKINMGSSGNGTTQHLAGELFKIMTGVNLVHVPYRGAPQALMDLIGGQVQVSFDPLPASIEYIKSGRLRALALTTATRSEALPDLPTVGEYVPGYEASAWNGFCAPASTPVEIVGKLNKAINEGLAHPRIKAQLAGLGATALAGSPGDFGKLIADETEKWGKVIRAADIKPV
jgi:tripartite-type tricarboxylate transporter receptor subunit TctC